MNWKWGGRYKKGEWTYEVFPYTRREGVASPERGERSGVVGGIIWLIQIMLLRVGFFFSLLLSFSPVFFSLLVFLPKHHWLNG